MPSPDPIYRAMTGILQEVFFDQAIEAAPAMTAADVEGWTSFKQIEILLAVEERFAIKLTSGEMDSIRCIGDLVEIIRKRALPR